MVSNSKITKLFGTILKSYYRKILLLLVQAIHFESAGCALNEKYSKVESHESESPNSELVCNKGRR
jgi:hypothetical protein